MDHSSLKEEEEGDRDSVEGTKRGLEGTKRYRHNDFNENSPPLFFEFSQSKMPKETMDQLNALTTCQGD